MGVRCDKFIGYSVDITDKWDELEEDVKEKWLEDFNNKNEVEYDKLNFRPYYNRTGSLIGKVTILYDGMCGQYCKLLYVINYEHDAEDENSDSIVDSINTLLKDCGTPFTMKQQIKEVYRTIFNEDMNNTSAISANYIVHWH